MKTQVNCISVVFTFRELHPESRWFSANHKFFRISYTAEQGHGLEQRQVYLFWSGSDPASEVMGGGDL